MHSALLLASILASAATFSTAAEVGESCYAYDDCNHANGLWCARGVCVELYADMTPTSTCTSEQLENNALVFDKVNSVFGATSDAFISACTANSADLAAMFSNAALAPSVESAASAFSNECVPCYAAYTLLADVENSLNSFVSGCGATGPNVDYITDFHLFTATMRNGYFAGCMAPVSDPTTGAPATDAPATDAPAVVTDAPAVVTDAPTAILVEVTTDGAVIINQPTTTKTTTKAPVGIVNAGAVTEAPMVGTGSDNSLALGLGLGLGLLALLIIVIAIAINRSKSSKAKTADTGAAPVNAAQPLATPAVKKMEGGN